MNMNAYDMYTLVVAALVMELDEMDRNGVDAERLARAEGYLAWLRGDE